jgi:hypothetical protein
MKQEGNRLRLARAKGLTPIVVALPPELAVLPPTLFVEMRLVYEPISRRHQWHLVVDDGQAAPEPPGQATLAADLGTIHPAAVANEQGEVVIFTARDLRAINQYRRKQLASLQAVLARKQKGSRRWKRLARHKTFLPCALATSASGVLLSTRSHGPSRITRGRKGRSAWSSVRYGTSATGSACTRTPSRR